MRIAIVGAALAAAGCSAATNYDDPDGPRYAGDHTGAAPVPRSSFRAVTYNLRYAIEIDKAIAALRSPELADADVILMQELDAAGTDRIAAALGLRYVYYPASVHGNGRDFGPAVLTPHPIVADHKLILPYHDPIQDRQRTATAAVLDVGGAEVTVYSVHTSIITLGLAARLEQVDAILDDAAAVAGPVIAGGDFNTGDPGSSDQTIDRFEDRGWAWASAGTDDTGKSRGLWFLLDYVFARDLPARSAGVFRGDAGSDHLPVWAVLDAP